MKILKFLKILKIPNEIICCNRCDWYLSRSAFLVSFTDINKQLSDVKYVFNFLNYGPSV